MNLKHLRETYHEGICQEILGYRSGVPNTADESSKSSIELAQGILTRMEFPPCREPPNGQRAEALLVSLTRDYLQQAFGLIEHLRPGSWVFSTLENAPEFDQYEHLTDLARVLSEKPSLPATLWDHLIKPDIVVGRSPVSDQEVNQNANVLQGDIATLTHLRANNLSGSKPILHATVSCKWRIRSDRGQTPRTEVLNLIRNRKGHVPHIVAVTAEPTPLRIAALALGTGDLDCVYHFALPEMKEAVLEIGNEDHGEMLNMLIEGRRLRDISDLPFDLAT